MLTELDSKSEFVLALREHLKREYKTEYHHTCGEGNIEGQKVGDGHYLIRRDPNKPIDISGFYFRKDLCSWTPQNKADVLKGIIIPLL